MSYKSIDPIIYAWAKDRNLHVYTEHREEEVRSVDLVGTTGERRCQLWIDAPEATGRVHISIWDYQKRRQDVTATPENLLLCLEEAYAIALNWLGAASDSISPLL